VREAAVALVQLDVVGDPQRRRVAQRRIGAREIEQARAALDSPLRAWLSAARG